MSLSITETQDVALCQALRRKVFIEEQGVSEADELDAYDKVAMHLLATLGGTAVGTARLLVQGSVGKIGRVCVLASARGQGIGKALILTGVQRLGQIDGVVSVRLGAQTHAVGFYAALGFVAFGPVYVDAGIAHQDMQLTLGT